TIRIRRALDRMVVTVQHREGVGQSEVIGNVVAREVRHRNRALLDRPSVVLPQVPGGVVAGPAVIGSWEVAQAEAIEPGANLLRIDAERRGPPGALRPAAPASRAFPD